MSIVIDANTLSLVFCPTPNDDFGPHKRMGGPGSRQNRGRRHKV